jgi:hypothetical protein
MTNDAVTSQTRHFHPGTLPPRKQDFSTSYSHLSPSPFFLLTLSQLLQTAKVLPKSQNSSLEFGPPHPLDSPQHAYRSCLPDGTLDMMGWQLNCHLIIVASPVHSSQQRAPRTSIRNTRHQTREKEPRKAKELFSQPPSALKLLPGPPWPRHSSCVAPRPPTGM